MNLIRRIVERDRWHRDLSAEIAQHLKEKSEDLMESGMSREEALLAARREFGNVTLVEERGREVWRWTALEDFFFDIRFAFRQFRKVAAFALAGVLTLALGIGANTAVFSVVNAVILRPLRYSHPDRLVSVQSRDISGAPHPEDLSYPTFFDFRENNRVFEHIVSYRDDEFSLTGAGEAIHLRGYIVSWDVFPMLGVQPALGRGFLPSEESAGERPVVLSHDLWTVQFGADPKIVGKTVRIDSRPHTVVGVAPPGFNFPVENRPVQIWTTLARDAASATVQPVTKQRGAKMLDVMARLKPGVSIEQAQIQMDEVAAALARQYPDTNRNISGTYVRPELENLIADTRDPLLIVLGAVGLVLLVACANIANLLLARTAEREREFALRAAIGAGRARIVRQVLAESLMLALAGCVMGVLAAVAATRWMLPLAENSIPRIQETTIDGRVLAFSVALALATCVLFSFAPAWRIRKGAFSGALKEGSRTNTDNSDGLRSALCVGQIALGLVLMSCASLLIASFLHLTRDDPGFSPERVLSLRLSLPDADYRREKQLDFYARLIEASSNLPGAVSAAAAMPLPLTGSQMSVSFNIQQHPTRPGDRPRSDMAIVTPGYFRTLGVPLLEGREFTERDDAKAPPVLIVNQAFARKFFAGESAIGKWIEPGATSDAGGTKMREIVGVVGNAKQSPMKTAGPIYYFPYQQLPWCCPAVLVRTVGSPLAISSAVRGIVASLDRQLPVYDVRSLDEIRSSGFARPRFQMLLLGSFAAIALLLTLVGLYGVLAYSVVRRTREIGVRIALGASYTEVLALVLKRAMLLVLLGVSLGLAGAFAGGRLLTRMLYGVAPHDPLLLATACCIITFTAAVAAYLPARRAASIDPVQALRAE